MTTEPDVSDTFERIRDIVVAPSTSVVVAEATRRRKQRRNASFAVFALFVGGLGAAGLVALDERGATEVETATADTEPAESTTTEAPEREPATVTTALPSCADLPDWASSDESVEFTEQELIDLADQVWLVVGNESGLQAARIGRVNRVGLDFVDPPDEGFDEVLAQLPEGYCIDSILFTPGPPAILDIISETGDVSPLPEGVDQARVWFAPSMKPSADNTEIHFLAQEQTCASGEEMGDRLLGPEVYESDSEILIAVGVVIQLTDQECPSHPPTEVTVVLEAPVGDREIRNAISGALMKVEFEN